MLERQRTEQTYRCELWRAGAAGILESAGTTFLLLIAVRWFAAGSTAKGLLAAGGSVGLLVSPLVVSVVTARGYRVGRAGAAILTFGGVCFCVAALFPFLPVFVAGSMLGMAASSAIIPLLTQMYQENYPEEERGRRFSRTVMIRIAMAAGFSHLAGSVLSGHIGYFRVLLLIFGISLFFANACLARCPTRPIEADGSSHPLRALRFVREDVLFRRTLICWMLMGFANLMMLPLRVEYLANPKYGLQLSIQAIAFLTGVVPNLARLAMSPVWGYLFDRMNFFALRVTLNIGFAVGILAFFMSGSYSGMIAGAIVFGISNAGGDVAWSLWVTKFAPPNRVADYMSVHTALTGFRGVLAPLVAFYVTGVLPHSLGSLACISAGLILLATLVLVPELKTGRRAAPASALVEEVTE